MVAFLCVHPAAPIHDCQTISWTWTWAWTWAWTWSWGGMDNINYGASFYVGFAGLLAARLLRTYGIRHEPISVHHACGYHRIACCWHGGAPPRSIFAPSLPNAFPFNLKGPHPHRCEFDRKIFKSTRCCIWQRQASNASGVRNRCGRLI